MLESWNKMNYASLAKLCKFSKNTGGAIQIQTINVCGVFFFLLNHCWLQIQMFSSCNFLVWYFAFTNFSFNWLLQDLLMSISGLLFIIAFFYFLVLITYFLSVYDPSSILIRKRDYDFFLLNLFLFFYNEWAINIYVIICV